MTTEPVIRPEFEYEVDFATGQPYLGTPQMAADTRRPIVPYSVPVLDERGAVVVVVRASLSLTALSATLTGVRPGLNARIALDDLDRRLILAHVDPARILRPSSGKNAATELTDRLKTIESGT